VFDHLGLNILKVGGGVAAWWVGVIGGAVVGMQQVNATHFAVTTGDILQFAALITGPPTVAILFMWRHLSSQDAKLAVALERVQPCIDTVDDLEGQIVRHREETRTWLHDHNETNTMALLSVGEQIQELSKRIDRLWNGSSK